MIHGYVCKRGGLEVLGQSRKNLDIQSIKEIEPAMWPLDLAVPTRMHQMGDATHTGGTMNVLHRTEHNWESQMHLREASMEDAHQIASTWVECLGNAGYHCIPKTDDALQTFRSRIEDPRSRIWVATVGAHVIGWQGLADFGPTQVIRAALSSTYVSANWQRNGIGRNLLLHAMRYADKSALQYVLGWIRRDNLASVNLVLSLGWTLVGTMPHSGRFEHPLDYYAYAAGDNQR
jgi:L-amino acid N-acyltransferase YncA